MQKKFFLISFCLLLLTFSPFSLAANKTSAAKILTDKTTANYTTSTPQITRKRKIKILTSRGASQFRNINLKYNQHRKKLKTSLQKLLNQMEK